MEKSSKNPKGAGRNGKYKGEKCEVVSLKVPVSKKAVVKAQMIALLERHLNDDIELSPEELKISGVKVRFDEFRKLLTEYRNMIKQGNVFERQKKALESKMNKKLQECYEASGRLLE